MNRILVITAAALTGLSSGAEAKSPYTVLHSFHRGHDGGAPQGNLAVDAMGNIYGAAAENDFGRCDGQCGLIFKLSRRGRETVLYNFNGAPDGRVPTGVILNPSTGDLEGTTASGGASSNCDEGCGALFRLTPSGTETVLHSFDGSHDGQGPSSIISDTNGNSYGTAYGGGAGGYGTVFRYSATGKFRVLHAFTSGNDGANPQSGLVGDDAGNLYGTTQFGGPNDDGTVFKVASNGKLTVLYSFTGGEDGAYPLSRVVRDSAGNLYGATESGGTSNCNGGCGIVYELAADGTETILHRFTGGADGGYPQSDLLQDSRGDLYGTTNGGGANNKGTIFKLGLDGTEDVLHNFSGDDGEFPVFGLIMTNHAIYGATPSGGTDGYGVVFRLRAK